MTEDTLLELLKELKKAIVGPWFLIGGGMLGLHRDGKLLPWDHDLDICLLPGSYIDKSKLEENVGYQDYYMDSKVFFKTDNPYKPKSYWLEYLSFKRVQHRALKLNRAQLAKMASTTYKTELIIPEFSETYIDIYYLYKENDKYYIPYWEEKEWFNLKEIDELQCMKYKDVDILLPTFCDDVCERIYGKDWHIPNKDFKHI